MPRVSAFPKATEWTELDHLYTARDPDGTPAGYLLPIRQLQGDFRTRRVAPYRRPSNATVWNFTDHTQWTIAGNFSPTPTVTTDTTEHPGTGNAAVKVAVPIVPAGSGTKQWRLSRDFGAAATVDIRQCTITVRYYADAKWRPEGDACDHAAFYLEMSDCADVYDAVGGRRRWSLPLSPGWHTVELTIAWGTDVRTPDLSAIRSMCISYQPNTTGGNDEAWNIWLDYVMFTPSTRTKGGFIIGFDDAIADCLEAAKVFHAYGLRSMVFAEPDTWGVVSGRATVEQLHQCQDYGMLVCCHKNATYFDRIGYPHVLVDDEDIHEYCRDIKRRMLEEGFTNGADFYAFTGGTSRIQSESHVRIFREYFAIVRGTGQLRTQGMEPFRLGAHVDGAAVDKGGGLVGIPTPDGHSLQPGWKVIFQGTTDAYEQGTVYTVHADTTANEVVITAAYDPTTFDSVSLTPRATNAILGTGQTNYILNPANPQEPWWRYAIPYTADLDADWIAEHENRVDAAIETLSVFECYYHGSDATGWTTDRLEQLAQMLRERVDAGTLEVLTYEDLVA